MDGKHATKVITKASATQFARKEDVLKFGTVSHLLTMDVFISCVHSRVAQASSCSCRLRRCSGTFTCSCEYSRSIIF